MTENINDFINELNTYEEFEFLNFTMELKFQVKMAAITLDSPLSVSKVDKFPFVNYYVNYQDMKSYNRITRDISSEIFELLFLEHNIKNPSILKSKVLNSLLYILEQTNLEHVNKEILLFHYLIKENIKVVSNKIFNEFFKLLVQQKVKNIEGDSLRFKYLDLSLKLGNVFFDSFLKTIVSDSLFNLLISKKFNKKKYSIYFEKSPQLSKFIYLTKKVKKTDLFIKNLRLIFKNKNTIISNYFYKLIRNFYIYNLYVNENIFPKDFSESHSFFIGFLTKFGCLLVESFKEQGLISVSYIKINKFKKELTVKCDIQNVDITKIFLNLQRPYVTKNTLKNIIKKTDERIQRRNKKKKKYDDDYYDAIEIDLLNLFCKYREKYFIGYNDNITTTLNKKTYLKSKNNLATRFVVDKDYLYYFLNLLKYHMLEKQNDSKLPFIQQLEKHENIFLLYQISIESIKTFYEKHKNISYLTSLFNSLLSYILDYNLHDFEILEFYKEFFKKLYQQEYNNLKQKFIKTFVLDLLNNIFSYKEFIKSLLQECILYVNFRFFFVDCFVDNRGRCYYTGFYLNPQSYPLSKAFIKLYNPTRITEHRYLNVVLPTVKAYFTHLKYKNILDKDFDTYMKYINKRRILREEFLNSFLNINLNIDIDIFERFKNINDSTELSLKILEFIKPKIKKIKRLYVVHSMIIRILYEKNEIQNYYELDATASGLQMTAMLFQNYKLAEISNLVAKTTFKKSEKDLEIYDKDIYAQCSYFFISKLDLLKKHTHEIFSKKYKDINLISDILKYYNNYLNDLIDLEQLITFIDKLISKLKPGFKKSENLKKFYDEHNWIIKDEIKNTNINLKELCYLILIKGIKMNFLRQKFIWLDDWINSRDFCKKAIMTFGYNATAFRRKNEWTQTLLELNNYEEKQEIYFISNISENLFNFIILKYLKPSMWLRNLGDIIKIHIKKNIGTKSFTKENTQSVSIINHYFKINLHCYKYISKRIDVKGLTNKRIHQLSVRYPVYKKKLIQINDLTQIFLIKQQRYELISRKFAPNFIHSMDAFLVHLFKEKIFSISEKFKQHNIVLNHMTNHDNFSLTLEPFLKLLLMDCYSIVYRYDYIQTLNSMDFFYDIELYKSKIQSNYKNKAFEMLPGNFFKTDEKHFIYKPLELELSSDFVK